MPAAGLDPSWMLGLNQAIAQGLAFGKDIIFSYGPYSSIYTEAYHPATSLMMTGGSLYLAFSWWVCLVFLMTGVQWRWILALCICISGMIYARDSLLFSYPLLVGLVTYKMLYSDRKLTSYAPYFFTFLFAPFGLLPLVKASLLIFCLVVLALCFIYILACKRINLAIICLMTPVISMLLFWIGSGQSPVNLPDFLINTVFMAGGFTEAMGLEGNPGEVILYILGGVFICMSILCQKQIRPVSRLFIKSLFLVFLFFSFKSGFIRHNVHAFIPATSILMAALILPFAFRSKMALPLVMFSVLIWAYIINHYTNISIFKNILANSTTTWHGVESRFSDSNWLKQNYDLSIDFMKNQASLPVLQGTTDIYSCKQTHLIASGNTWSPRPIIQSYSAFSPMLARKNAQHLQGNTAPDNIIFRMEPIDGRIPSLEDGASWPFLLANYQPTHMDNDFVFLRKKNRLTTIPNLMVLKQEKHYLQELVKVPGKGQLVFGEITIKPTLSGYMASTILKPGQLTIVFELADGSRRPYRIITNMAKSTFLISPLVENTAEFAMLYRDENALNAKVVKAISIAATSGSSWQWQKEYSIQFKTQH